MEDMELRCQSVLAASRSQTHTIRSFIQELSNTIPDTEGNIETKQLAKLYALCKSVKERDKQPQQRIHFVDFNVKFPDSYQRLKGCQQLADSVSGKIEELELGSFLNDPMEEDVGTLKDEVVARVGPVVEVGC